MTATGLVLFLLAIAVSAAVPRGFRPRPIVKLVVTVFALTGACLFGAGVITWAWRVMP